MDGGQLWLTFSPLNRRQSCLVGVGRGHGLETWGKQHRKMGLGGAPFVCGHSGCVQSLAHTRSGARDLRWTPLCPHPDAYVGAITSEVALLMGFVTSWKRYPTTGFLSPPPRADAVRRWPAANQEESSNQELRLLAP